MTTRLLSRRQFVASAAATGVATLGFCRRATSADETRRKIKYIDIHTHIGAFYYGRELTADMLVRWMDQHDVERAVILPLISPEAAPIPQTTQAAIAAHKAHPTRLIPFCIVDPRATTTNPKRYGHVAGVKGLIQILERYKEAGCKGVGEHKTGLFFDAPQNMYLYEASNAVGLPILFHLDDIRNIDTPGLPRLENALKTFPKLPLIGHAAGFWASISGDATFESFGRYPKIPSTVAPGGALDRLMETYSNLYGDLSAPGGEKAIARDPTFGREFIIRRSDQLLFGTDILMPDQKIAQFELLDSLDLPEDVQYKIYRGNAIRLLQLDELD
ncbi:MAG: amidohydrolase family protein [Planctomycetes bacterium]|nr:amidohydrolase family protein [Planctomycetota bacterium]MBL7044711.1 amidohydrolase family protein [Pirellulaceae bacterium]